MFYLTQNHRAELKRMLVQHNIRIISKYYGQLTLERVSQLLQVERDYCEEELCCLNNLHTISCRIDRIDGIIDFKPIENEQYLLKNWNQSINSILDLVDTTTNLIHREREVYKK
jgi:26S proteasome regulatory subunit N5